MSSYANATDDFPMFGLPSSAIAAVPPANVQAALDRASNLADGYIGAEYALPLKSWSSELTEAVCKIAAYELMSVRGYNPEGDGGNLRARYKDAIAWLTDVSKGAVAPPGIVGSDGEAEAADGVADMSSDPPRGWAGSPPNGGSSTGSDDAW